MIYQIKVSEDAKRDIRRISNYILEYRVLTVLKRMQADIKKLKTMPRAHKTLYSFNAPNEEYRRMLSNGYAIIYQIVENQITILRIFSNKQNYLNQNNFILKEESQSYTVSI